MGKKKARKKVSPLWKGPDVDGVTQSLLGRFLVCRERFRALVVDGLKPEDQFHHRMEFGNLWHECEHANAEERSWQNALKKYANNLIKRYPVQQEQVLKWYNVVKVQFPLYLEYWKTHEKKIKKVPLYAEQCFSVPYTLPSGRVVLLRGKWDGINWHGSKANGGVYTQENKTKGEVDFLKIQRQLSFDIQTMMYSVALREAVLQGTIEIPSKQVLRMGVYYNVIRRPLSGGKGSIKKRKPTKSNPRGETDAEYYVRLAEVLKENQEEYYFRWQSEIHPHDLKKFERTFLQPCLESLWNWWEHIQTDPTGFAQANENHWRTPFGFWNVLAEGGTTDLDAYLENGSKVGLRKATTLFEELE